jgi:PDZ domain
VRRVLLLAFTFFLAISAGLARADAPPKHGAPSPWERSIVTLEVSRKQYDYYQPWTRLTTNVRKVGTVIDDHQILTTAQDLFDRTLVRLQKGGRGKWTMGEVTWIDYHANLALVTTTDADFWQGLKPATLGGPMPVDRALQVFRWRESNLESRRVQFTAFAVREGQLGPLDLPVLETSSELQGGGWGEPLVANGRVLGLVRAQDPANCLAIPASFIKSVLAARQKGEFHGLGYFHFYWQPSENPASLASLKLPGDPRGVIIDQVPDRPDACEQVLKPLDIILRIDGFDIDTQGNYDDPEFGHVLLENLAVRRKWAGDDVKMQIWRDGKPLDVTYRLPKFEYTNSLVPFAAYDQEPEYLIVGGLVFQPLLDSYLQAWGSEWRQRSPFRLRYYSEQMPSRDRTGLVILSQVLPDPYNIGYQAHQYLIVDKVNGQRISHLGDLRQALKKPVDGFHVLEFFKADDLRRIVLAAGQAEEDATARVLQRYGIAQSLHFAEPEKPSALQTTSSSP